MVVERLIEERKKREEIFRNLEFHLKELKRIAENYFGNCRFFLFGSVARGDYDLMLSDVDVAIITDCKDREKILKFKVEISRRWYFFELHVLDERKWEFYKKFIDVYKEF
ncbi:MAG: nucleotidyltransferase domain-containing protein [Archaeoglobaceae archaeon]